MTQDFISQVKYVIAAITEKVASSPWCPVDPESIIPGKMLRTRLAGRLAACDLSSPNLEVMVYACAATELVHTASLFHDDVIDNGRYNIPLGTKTTLMLIKGQIYSAILEVDADSPTYVSADVTFGDNNPAGDIIKFVAD